MDRLTKKTEQGNAFVECGISKHTTFTERDTAFGKQCVPYGDVYDGAVIDRLAAYEDTGLEPSEISEREEMFVAYRHICGGKSPEEAQSNFEELSAYRTAEEQRNKGCDFCNGHEHYHFYAGYSQQLDIVDKFVEREIEEINFCPICGRALKGGE